MRKRKALTLLAAVLVAAMCSSGAFAQEIGTGPVPEAEAAPAAYEPSAEASERAENMLQSAETLKTDTVPLQVTETSAGITAVVRDFTELQAALQSGSVTGAYIFNDIQMDNILTINKDFSFYTFESGVTLFPSPGKRHFQTQGTSVEIDLGTLILDGNGTRGGMETYAASTVLRNGTIQNNNNPNGASGAIYAPYELHIIDMVLQNNSCHDLGGAIYGKSITVTDSLIQYNQAGYTAGGIFAEEELIFNSGAIRYNTAPGAGGVYLERGTMTMYGGDISYNVVPEGYVGGGINAGPNTEIMLLGGSITNNEATGGGGICSRGVVTMFDGLISHNRVSKYGGGIHGENVIIYGGEISYNHADTGGAVHLLNLRNLEVYEEVIFQGNTAEKGYFMNDPADIDLHQELIRTTHFSAPFTEYAYNNYDIAYTKGTLLNTDVTVRFFMDKAPGQAYRTIALAPGTVLPELPAEPDWFGYEFVGWFYADGSPFDASVPVDGDTDLYAAWFIL